MSSILDTFSKSASKLCAGFSLAVINFPGDAFMRQVNTSQGPVKLQLFRATRVLFSACFFTQQSNTKKGAK